MIIATTYENGNIFQHFGHTEQFKLYYIDGNTVTSEQIADTQGQGHGALAGFLLSRNVSVLLCGGIGSGAVEALTNAGIKIYGGIKGSADKAVSEYIAGTLKYDSGANCGHHDHAEHSCGENHNGCHGSGNI